MFLILKMYLFMSLILAAKLGIVWDCLLLAVGEFPDFPIIFGSPAFGQFKGDNNCNWEDDHQDHERVGLHDDADWSCCDNCDNVGKENVFFCIHKQFQFSFQILTLCTSVVVDTKADTCPKSFIAHHAKLFCPNAHITSPERFLQSNRHKVKREQTKLRNFKRFPNWK